MIEIGWCMEIEQAQKLRELGFDYIECPVTALNLEEERTAKQQIKQYRDAALQVKAMNIFFPQGLQVVGPNVDDERIRNYVINAGEAASEIGSSIVVLGSGRARTIPEGWERQRAEAQILQLLEMIAAEWNGSGAVLALEPLNRKESNMINSITEAVDLARQVDHPTIKVLADLYHMMEENEPLEQIAVHQHWIAHIHIADTGRYAPGTGTYPYQSFARILKEMQYKGMISAECRLQGTDNELTASLQFMRKCFQEVIE